MFSITVGRRITPSLTGWQTRGLWPARILSLSSVATRKTWMPTERWPSWKHRALLRRTVSHLRGFVLLAYPPPCLCFLCCRANVPGDQRSDWGKRWGRVPEMRSHHPQQDRLRWTWFIQYQQPVCACESAPCVGCSDLGCVWQVSWTQKGWALGFSMETHHWGSYDSREAPPHRINSSAVARDRLTLIHKPPRTGRPLQVSHWHETTQPTSANAA